METAAPTSATGELTFEAEPLRAALDQLAGLAPEALADGETVVDLERQLARLEAVVCRSAAAFEASRAWSADGARSARMWLAIRCRLPKALAGRHLRLGRRLRDLGRCEAAWLDGRITGAHVGVIAGLENPRSAEALRRDEELLVDQAETLGFSHFTRAAAYWGQLADPEGTDESAEERRGRRGARFSETMGGMWVGEVSLDPISGAVVTGELTRLEQKLFEADWAEATERLGHGPTVGDLTRTPRQRRADAMVEMAVRSRATPPGAKRPAPLFSVLVGWETLAGRICQLASGRVVAPGDLARLVTEADFERAVFDSPARVEVSASARLFTGATRRGVEVRDQECTHPYCEEPYERCQVDHIVPYTQGGPTTQENGRLRCGHHNRLRNQRPPPS